MSREATLLPFLWSEAHSLCIRFPQSRVETPLLLETQIPAQSEVFWDLHVCLISDASLLQLAGGSE